MPTTNLSRLHRFIVEHYDLEEFRTLCFDLSVSYDNLKGEGLEAKARELILHLGRLHQLDQLLPQLLRAHANLFDLAGISIDLIILDKFHQELPAWKREVGERPDPRDFVQSLRHWLPYLLASIALFALGFGLRGQVFRSMPPVQGAPQTSSTSTALVTTNLVKYFDLQSSAEGWTDIKRYDENWDNPVPVSDSVIPPIPGERGVAYDLALNAGKWWNYVVKYPDPIQADVIVAHVYLSSTAEVENNWVGIQATDGKQGPWLAKSATGIPLGEWRTLVLDLRDKYDSDDKRLSDKPVYFEIFVSVLGKTKLSKAIVRARIDDVALYKSTGDTAAARPEKRGTGRTLFDFEDANLDDWKLAYGRDKVDTFEIYWGVLNRGWALQWNTRLTNKDEKSFLETKRAGLPPQGGVVARVFLPNSVPDTTSLWANLYASGQGQWTDSRTILLKKGQWNTLAWDTRNVDWAGMKDVSIGVQIGLDKGTYQGPIYVDDIEIFDN